MNIDRLKHEKAILAGIAARNLAFNLGNWIANQKDSVGSIEEGTVGDLSHTCGTACCAFGYAGLDPEFQAQGLGIRASITDDSPNGFRRVAVRTMGEYNALVHAHGGSLYLAEVTFEDEKGFPAAAKFFDLSPGTAHWLFDPDRYPYGKPVTPQMVIDRIDALIENDGIVPPKVR